MIHWIGQPEEKTAQLDELCFDQALHAPETHPIHYLYGEIHQQKIRLLDNEKIFAVKLVGPTAPLSPVLQIADLNPGDQVFLYEKPNGGWQFILTLYIVDEKIDDQTQMIHINDFQDELVVAPCWFPINGAMRVGEYFNFNLDPSGAVKSMTREIEMIVLKQYNPAV